MKLGDLSLPISYHNARQWALVFSSSLASRLSELHEQHGSRLCRPVPRLLTDGRFMLSADVLTEIGPGGLLESMWKAADKDILMVEIEVMPWIDAVSMLVPDSSENEY